MTQSLADDPWIVENSKISPAKLHALGVVAYRWNLTDLTLKSVLIATAGFEFFRAWAIIHEMGDVAVGSAIEEIITRNKFPDDIREAVLHGLELYDANRINRNQLTHFVPVTLEGTELARMKGPTWNPQPFSDSITDLRRVADEIGKLFDYLVEVSKVLYAHEYTKLPGYLPSDMPKLPDKLPVPKRLWTPPPPNPQGRKERPDKGPG